MLCNNVMGFVREKKRPTLSVTRLLKKSLTKMGFKVKELVHTQFMADTRLIGVKKQKKHLIRQSSDFEQYQINISILNLVNSPW